MQTNESVQPIIAGLNIEAFTLGLIQDLNDLRAGKIDVPSARARAELAKQALRAVGYVLQAQRLLVDRARTIKAIGDA